jgi:anti-sigma regulatory factor (Ser/Thr protein kinase)
MDAMMTAEERCFVCISESYEATANEALRIAQQDVLRAERDKVNFCREMARMATHDKLILCDHEEVPPRRDVDCLDIIEPRDVRQARHAAAATARDADWPQDRIYALQLCIGEAGANAIQNAGAATFQVWRDCDSITVHLADKGPGIDLSGIPAALRSGFSTGSTLGMGFTLMLDVADRIHLATDHRGTIIQLTLSAS